VAQETLSNIVAHAQASEISVQLHNNAGVLNLFIQDNGIGFDEKSAELNGKYGLLGMRERAEMIGGHLSITSQPGGGTQVRLTYGELK
jgi:signal transduction histidine kinase